MSVTDISYSEEIFTVSRLNREVRFLLEGSFPAIWIEGEISNFLVPQSGHWYFSLKDSSAQVRCAMFRLENRKLNFTPKDGMHCFLKARISLYEGRGDYQLLIEHIEEAGQGKLQREFEALKKRLSDAGLFALTHKKTLPILPKQIGVITSSTGAAIRDILHVLKRRFSVASIIIYPTLVQGSQASANIVNAIKTANARRECDVLILARGGGSIEDLWPFNEENVAEAIFQSVIPIISGIGHEIDFTIADFVADVRAPTPSAAAELITPDQIDLLNTLHQKKKQLIRGMTEYLNHLQKHIVWLTKHLQQQHPKRRIKEQLQKLDQFEMTLIHFQSKLLESIRSQLTTYQAKWKGLTPKHRLTQLKNQIHHQEMELQHHINQSINKQYQRLETLSAALNTLSPLATLKRGYAIATKNKNVLLDASSVAIGDLIQVKLFQGNLDCIIQKKQ